MRQEPSAAIPNEAPTGSVTDFDFLIGRWNVHHRRLASRLTGSSDWQAFDGTCVTQKILDGQGNVDDCVLNLPAGRYHAAAVRVFDDQARAWSIFWIDSRYPPAEIDPPVVGGFSGDRGLFFSDGAWRGRPVRTRFVWRVESPELCLWEQALSTDRGATWETNWHMRFERTGS